MWMAKMIQVFNKFGFIFGTKYEINVKFVVQLRLEWTLFHVISFCLRVGNGRVRLHNEMQGFNSNAGRVSYVLTLACTAVTWQMSAVGVVGLIFIVSSSLFSNVIDTLSSGCSCSFLIDKMNGMEVGAMLLASFLWVCMLHLSKLSWWYIERQGASLHNHDHLQEINHENSSC